MGLTQGIENAHLRYKEWLTGPLILIAVLVVVRFILEAAGVSKDVTRFVSVGVGGALAVIYLGAIAPLRGITKFKQLVWPAVGIAAWIGVWTALALVVSAALRLPGSHFADAPRPFQNWQHLATHVLVGHLALPVALGSLINLGMMALMFWLHRWPIVVAPSAVLGGLVVLRFAAEAMNLAPTTASAWSSTVGILVGAFYLGGIGPRMGLVSARQLLGPSVRWLRSGGFGFSWPHSSAPHLSIRLTSSTLPKVAWGSASWNASE